MLKEFKGNKTGINTGIKPKQKKVKKVIIVLGIILVVITVCMLIGSILHATYFKNKKEEIEPYGQMIDVYDGQMHVFKMGSGKDTIILLPGMGIGLPSADFGPLMRQLSKKHTVVCIEYFGVGFSSQTQRARTSENYVDEIRIALKSAGIEAPYILMAHSISSVYSEYYASKYPDEVQAIISLDGTSSAYIGADMPGFVKSLLGVAKFQQAIGITAIVAPIATNKDNLLSIGYTEKEISDLIYYAGFSMNDNTLDQLASSTDYIKDTNQLTYPENVPYFKIISRKTYETKNSQIMITPQEYQEQHLARIGDQAKYEILDGTHFIYLNNVDRISEITDEFLSDISVGDDY
jgi:pimeloyl-ACP methyl ester carboxylesterase